MGSIEKSLREALQSVLFFALIFGQTRGQASAGFYTDVSSGGQVYESATRSWTEDARIVSDAGGALVSDSTTRVFTWYLSSDYFSDPFIRQQCGTSGVAACEGAVTWVTNGRAEAQYGQLRTWASGELEVKLPAIAEGDNDWGIMHSLNLYLQASASQVDAITFSGGAPGSVGYATFYWRYHAEFSGDGLVFEGGIVGGVEDLFQDGFLETSLATSRGAQEFCFSWELGNSGLCAASVPFSFGVPLSFQLSQSSRVDLWAPNSYPQHSGRSTITVDAFSTVSLDRIVVRDAAGRAVPNLVYVSESGSPYDVSTSNAVPEPSTLGLLLVAGVAVAGRRKLVGF